MSRRSEILYIGIGGHVVAVKADSGEELWRQKCKGSGFVAVHVTGDAVYAGTVGEAFCLNRASGKLRWHNKLKGLGQGLVCFGSASSAAMAALAAADADTAALIAASTAATV